MKNTVLTLAISVRASCHCQVFPLVMAESVLVQEKSLEDLESEITCPICQEHYTEPKVLPCLHYYCKKCILKLVLRTQSGKSFHCPECRCEATLPEGGVDNLKTAFFANRLKSKVTTLQRAHGKVEVKCELCTASSNAEAFCRQCARFICKECILIHTKIQTFLTHEVASLEDLKHGQAKPIAVEEPPTEMCTIHKQPFIIFCSDCEKLICQHCTLKDHLGHNYEFTNVAATGVKTKLLEDIEHVKDLQTEYSDAVEKIHVTALEVKTQKESAINNLHTSFKELHNILEQREQELVEDATTIAQQKLQKLSQQEKTSSIASAELQSVVDYTKQCVSLSTDNELVSMDTEIRKTIQQKIQEHSKSGRSLESVEEADMAVEVTCAEALQQLCLTQAIIIAVDPAKCTVDLTAPAEVGKPYVGTLTTRLSNGKPNNRKCKVTCHIKSLCNGVTTDCVIVKEGPDRYSIQYIPTVRGRHELTVLINGSRVAGSPFPVYVSIHPTQLGKPVKIWTGIAKPSGITANSKGEILVALSEGSTNVVKFDAEGKRVDLVEKSGLFHPRSIACDADDNIYCVDEKSNMMLTCDCTGDNTRIHEVQLEMESSGCSVLKIVDNKLFIAEIKLPGIIKIYDLQLKLITSIKHKNMDVRDISIDPDRNLYVSDIRNSCIHKFAASGTYLHTFGNTMAELQHPWGLCVHGQHVYVTDVASHCVFVFTTDGSYVVTSFGQKGQEEGEFNWPAFIFVDNDGFVCVTDLFNNRLQHF